MKYRFNDRIIFDADTGMLSLSDLFDEPVAISNPSKRLLQLLIAHQGEAVNREVIFKKVWDDYGMISSNNNLNQCVSKLRRVIKALGIDDEVIVTVPKVGFMLRNEILVEPCQAEEKGADSDEPSASVADSVSANRSLLKMLSVRPLRYGWGMLGFIFVAAAGIALYAFSPTSRQESYLGKVGSCSVFMLSSATPADVDFTSDVLAYVERKKVQCSADEYLLLIRSNQVNSYSSGISRLFFLRCKTLREHKVEMCDGLESESSPLLD